MSTPRKPPRVTCDPDTAALCGLYEKVRGDRDSLARRAVYARFDRRVRELGAVVCRRILYRWDARYGVVERDARAHISTFWEPSGVEKLRAWRAANKRKQGKGADVAA